MFNTENAIKILTPVEFPLVSVSVNAALYK